MRASISHISDIHYLKVILTPVMPNPQNYSLLHHITFMRVAPVFIRYTPELHALWSVWMELATSPPLKWVSLQHLIRKLPKLDKKH